MNIRPDYLRTLEIFLNYEKINGKHLVRLSDFMEDFDTIFLGSSDAEEVLLEMYSLDWIKMVDANHLVGEDGMLLLEKGWDMLRKHRNMELATEKVTEIDALKNKIASSSDRGHKAAYIQTFDEIIRTYNADCRTATISLCGKVLEIFFYEILQNSSLREELYRFDEKSGAKYPKKDLSLWRLRSIASRLPSNVSNLLPRGSVINTITEYRNATIHYSEKNYTPSKRIVNGVIDFLVETLDEYFSKK